MKKVYFLSTLVSAFLFPLLHILQQFFPDYHLKQETHAVMKEPDRTQSVLMLCKRASRELYGYKL